MQYRYYLGKGAEATALLQDVRTKICDRNLARMALCQEYAAIAVYMVGNRVAGLVFDADREENYLKFECVMPGGGHAFTPRRNTRQGKLLSQRIATDPIIHFDAGTYIVEQLHVGRTVFEHLEIFETIAGFVDDTVLVQIPLGHENGMRGIDPFPTIPGWLQEVKESEFLKEQGL